jgi:oligopeptidase B
MLPRKNHIIVALATLVAFILACSGGEREISDQISAPVAKIVPRTDTLHGDVRVDNYYWLRERSNPEVIEYLEAENEYTKQMTKHTEEFQDKLYREMRARIKETDLSVPAKKGDYYYYSRNEENKQYKLYCRKKGSLDATEEILLDMNAIAKGHDYCDLGAYSISPDHNLLAYSIDTTGREKYALHFKDVTSGELLPDVVQDINWEAVWANDNATIFYTTLDETLRPYRLWRHTLGTTQTDDELVYQEDDQSYGLTVDKTRSDRFLLLELGSSVTSEVHFLPADNPTGEFRLIHPRQHEMEYYVSHHGNRFLIRTNDNALNFKLMDAPIEDPSKDNWREVIAHRDSVLLESADAFQNHLAIIERESGLKRIRIIDVKTGADHYVDFQEPVYTVVGGENPEFNTNTFRFNYTSFITPKSVYEYDMDGRTKELKKQDEVMGGYDPSMYQSERVFATASDGATIPISLVYRKGMSRDGSNPLLLYGYGSYGYSSEPRFKSSRLSMLDRGVINAIAHVRGGSELGRLWYEDGKMLNKRNTFTDFIACAERLIADKYTSSDRLAAVGGSAGGLLIGAVANMRPDLFKALVADVPFVDVVNTMLDESIPLTVIEYEEWGNPKEKEYYDYMLSYSPYDNVVAKNYPNLLILAGLTDPRVQYFEPAKWTAKLRALKTDDNALLLKANMGSGHFGATGRYDYLKEYAFELAFILDMFGISD